MKNSSTAMMQFSGYPLTIVEIKKAKAGTLVPVKKQPSPNTTTTAIQNNKISNDPQNWDEGWFNGYE